MFVLFIAILGIAIFGGAFVKFQILHIPMTYIVMAALCFSYVRYFAIKRGILNLKIGEKALFVFELYGLIMVFISFLGINQLFISKELFISKTYIPRQAYYLWFFPAIILFQDELYTKKIDVILLKYGKYVFWGLYFGHIITNRQFSLPVSTEFVLCWLAFLIGGTKKTRSNIIRLAVLIFTPIATGGELTNLIIRILFIAFFFINKKQAFLSRFLAICVSIMISAMFILPAFDKSVSSLLDANSIWRLRYWKDELIQLLKSYLLGVGYGTSYATQRFIGGSLHVVGGPFAASAGYSTLDKMYITGPHSSFVSIAFRLGVVGIISFVLFIKSMYKELSQIGQDVSAAALFTFFSSLVVIGVNVGLESPYYLIIFVFAMGQCVKEAHNHSIINRAI